MTSPAYLRIRAKRVEKVLKLVATTPQQTKKIALAIGVSESTAYLLLAEMQAEDQIHQVRRQSFRCWLAGPMPESRRDDPLAVYLPKRRILKAWPLHHVRDPLVAFLFGQPEVCHG